MRRLNEWLQPLMNVLNARDECVLVSVVSISGSTPREAGARMVVTATATYATIGGGQLEYQCIEKARDMLVSGTPFHSDRYALGPGLGQCCGGVVIVSFESVDKDRGQWISKLVDLERESMDFVCATILGGPLTTGEMRPRLFITECRDYGSTGQSLGDEKIIEAGRQLLARGQSATTDLLHMDDGTTVLLEPVLTHGLHIELFGAGHVGRAVINVLATLPCTIRWIDSRADAFPAELPANAERVVSLRPDNEVPVAPEQSCFLIMTHSHGLDQEICEQVLNRDDFKYCGLIGSKSKRRKFEKRLRARGITSDVLSKLTCPIGVSGLTGKHPAEIAIAVVAQILQLNSVESADLPTEAERIAAAQRKSTGMADSQLNKLAERCG